MYTKLSKLAASFLIICIYFFRPLLGPMNICPYTIGCTQYALMQLREQPLGVAVHNIIKRLLTCHPFRRTH